MFLCKAPAHPGGGDPLQLLHNLLGGGAQGRVPLHQTARGGDGGSSRSTQSVSRLTPGQPASLLAQQAQQAQVSSRPLLGVTLAELRLPALPHPLPPNPGCLWGGQGAGNDVRPTHPPPTHLGASIDELQQILWALCGHLGVPHTASDRHLADADLPKHDAWRPPRSGWVGGWVGLRKQEQRSSRQYSHRTDVVHVQCMGSTGAVPAHHSCRCLPSRCRAAPSAPLGRSMQRCLPEESNGEGAGVRQAGAGWGS